MLSWQFDDLTTTGPDPFPQSSSHNGAAVGSSSFTIGASASGIVLGVTDNDTDFEDSDIGSQSLTSDTVYNGTTYSAGDHVGANYSYIIRPAGSTDPADDIQIWIVRIGGVSGDSVGIVSDARLVPGTTYDFVALPEFADSPTVAYSSVYVCVTADTMLLTQAGPRQAGTLATGDRLLTLDNGPQPILWVARQEARFTTRDDPGRPILFPPGVLGDDAPATHLRLSPQHRVLIRDAAGRQVLGPAKALVDLQGVRVMRGVASVTYCNFLLPGHEIILANGAPVESFYPGPQALRVLPVGLRRGLLALCPGLRSAPGAAYGPPARPLLTVGQTRRLLRSARSAHRRGTPAGPGISPNW